MKLDLNVLNHLGLNLYSNTAAVLSEVIANAWDADATEVKIICNEDSISITDNGNGMDLNDINNKYLCVGYQKRKNGEDLSFKLRRHVMGRKGIGKLSLLSIADTIKIYSKKEVEKELNKEAFVLSRVKIESQITESNASYTPEEIEFEDFDNHEGTKIVISDFRKSINRTPESLKRRLARRFSVIGDNFEIIINGDKITIEDREFFNKVQFLWPIGDYDTKSIKKFKNIDVQGQLPGVISDENNYVISGWIGAVEKPSDISGNNNISIITRGKLSQEDILRSYNEGGIYASYLIGEIHANFLDIDSESDISTSSRQNHIENDERYIALNTHIVLLLKRIQGKWTALRNEKATEKITSENIAVKEWYSTLRGDSKMQAKKLFSTIESLHFDGDIDKKRELLKSGILAFERLKISENLSALNNGDAMLSVVSFGEIFCSIKDIEASLYWDIANERVRIIRELCKKCDDNVKEEILRNYIFDNLWLLNPSWERATKGSERMEQGVMKEFKSITDKLTPEEEKGRLDIRYRNTAGKHIIIELKRYIPTYKVDVYALQRQVDKYTAALKKCLKAIGKEDEPIESICLVGEKVIANDMSIEDANEKMESSKCRIILYDQIISDAYDSYSEYLESEKKVGEIRQLIDKI